MYSWPKLQPYSVLYNDFYNGKPKNLSLIILILYDKSVVLIAEESVLPRSHWVFLQPTYWLSCPLHRSPLLVLTRDPVIDKTHWIHAPQTPLCTTKYKVKKYMNQELTQLWKTCSRWPENLCFLFHRNQMPGSLVFTGSELWAPFNFTQRTALSTN